jgi:hypothetical protein
MRKLLLIVLTAVMSFALVALPTAANAKRAKHRKAVPADVNRDQIPDRWERSHKLSLRVNQAARDTDGDGLDNANEYLRRLDPRNEDSDHNGVADSDEALGTVAGLSGDKLVVTLAGGRTIRGAVNDETFVVCPDDGSDPVDEEDPASTADDPAATTGDETQLQDPTDDPAADPQVDPAANSDDSSAADPTTDPTDDPQAGADDPAPAECDVTSLTPGAAIQSATLSLTRSGPVFDVVELG